MLQSLCNMWKMYKHNVYYPSQTRAPVETFVLILCWPISVPGFIPRLIGASINAWLLYHWLFLDELFSRIQYPAEERMRTSLDALSQENKWTTGFSRGKPEGTSWPSTWRSAKKLLQCMQREAHGWLTLATLSLCMQEPPEKPRRCFLGRTCRHFDLPAGNTIEDSKYFVALKVNITLQFYPLATETLPLAFSPSALTDINWRTSIEWIKLYFQQFDDSSHAYTSFVPKPRRCFKTGHGRECVV